MARDPYETEELLDQYLLFHYGAEADQLPWDFGPRDALGFPRRCVMEGFAPERLPARGRALDVGCAVGRATFELATLFEEAIGIDCSETFIAAARRIAEQGTLRYRVRLTGLIRAERVAHRPAVPAGRVRFEHGDAHALRATLGSFDGVLAANLLCRLARPAALLERLPALVNPGGQLVITTPNTWLEAFTARAFWLGATPETGEPLEALRRHLEPHFLLDRVWDMPFLIREHLRKYQWSVAQASRWIRRAGSGDAACS